jgi:hypothetical protein
MKLIFGVGLLVLLLLTSCAIVAEWEPCSDFCTSQGYEFNHFAKGVPNDPLQQDVSCHCYVNKTKVK